MTSDCYLLGWRTQVVRRAAQMPTPPRTGRARARRQRVGAAVASAASAAPAAAVSSELTKLTA
jgi:hypothetical protein